MTQSRLEIISQNNRRIAQNIMRTFEDKPAKRERVPILLGVTGYAGSGKTWSSMRIAQGMRRVIGGKIFVVDTEGRRALQLAGQFEFNHIAMDAPFGSLDYLEALQHCKNQGASIVIVDQMTYEHSGEGGYLDLSEKFLDSKCGEDDQKRHRMLAISLKESAARRKKLNDWIIHSGMNIIFCYRAKEKMNFKTFQMEGWQPETTSSLIWDMVARFLLMPGSDGKPTLAPQMQSEKMLTKNPEFFRQWCKDGMQLNEDLGHKIAEWANEGVSGSFGAQAMRESIKPPVSQKAAPEPLQYELQSITGKAKSITFTKLDGVKTGYKIVLESGATLSTPEDSVIEYIKQYKGFQMEFRHYSGLIETVKVCE